MCGMENARVLAVYGHPDDEGQVTGTMAAFIARGAQVTLVCATRGEVGEISDPSLATPENLWYVRELELRASMAQIGLRDVRFLPYRDSGMAGTPENDDPRCLHQQPAEVVVRDLVAIIRELRPHVVFTWDPTGGYGHPDHVAVHKHTVAAFEASGDANQYPESGAPWAPQRLYWGAFTMKRFAGMFLEMERRGLMPEPIDPERRERFEKAMLEPDAPVSNVVEVHDFVAAKRLAASMHRSQFGENSMMARIPEDMRAQFYGEERFFQARPALGESVRTIRGIEELLPGDFS
jgi:LmbE family N-acetylglucosaminyl deacetylase